MSRCCFSSTFLRLPLNPKRHIRTRFAPSPTGPLHIGGLRTALVNFILARKDGGDFILRIEDTDQSRCSTDALRGIIHDLEWTGLVPDEGPASGGRYGPYIQSERFDIYKKFGNHLLQTGRAYRCFCSHARLNILRNEQRRRGETVRYDNRCRHLSKKEIESNLSQNLPYVLRFKMLPTKTIFKDLVFGEVNFQNATLEGDPVIMKSDGLPVYHLASVIDDHLMEISHVIRGSEWITSAPKHLQLYEAFDWQPPVFAHMPLMISSSGHKFSKRQTDQEPVALVHSLRRDGYLPSAILTWLSATGGLLDFTSPTSASKDEIDVPSSLWKPYKRIDEMFHAFNISSLTRHHARVDHELLRICGRAHFDRLVDEIVSGRAPTRPTIVDYLREYYIACRSSEDRCMPLLDFLEDEGRLVKILSRLKGRVSRLSELTSSSSDFTFLWKPPSHEALKSSFSQSGELRAALLATAVKLENYSELSEDHIKGIFQSTSKLTVLPKADFLKKLRVCMTGAEHGIPVHELVVLLTPKEAARRIREAGEVISDQ